MADNEYLGEDSGIVEEESTDRPSFTVSIIIQLIFMPIHKVL